MHKGKVVAKKGNLKVIDCRYCGFKHLYPLPTIEGTKKFYKKKYFNLIKKGGRAPEMGRLLKGGKERSSELKWLKSTLYKDISHILGENVPRGARNFCDIGCGTGDFLKYMADTGWKAVGIEPSEEGSQDRKNSKPVVYNLSLEDFAAAYPKHNYAFDAITLINILEHVHNPAKFLRHAKKLLKPHTGVMCIRVPNDFNQLQIQAQKKANKKLWWVAAPDHVNYFNMESLQRLVESLGFEVVCSTTDFPMEFFLLTGDDYIGNPEIGNLCHSKRVSFETSISDALRRSIYQNIAKSGIGRDSIIFARVK
jgi:2-polyprenyl-3-methyl-5-hydroxy-6-metoxy-1,4-benzoquinol methylase